VPTKTIILKHLPLVHTVTTRRLRFLVGAVGIEPNTHLMNLKDFAAYKIIYSAVDEGPTGVGKPRESN
jgi:hypothetical protein